jgi:hypothetical protein
MPLPINYLLFSSLEERRQLEPLLAFWSEFASALAAQVHSLCASVTAVYLPFFVFGRVLTRLSHYSLVLSTSDFYGTSEWRNSTKF